MVDGRWLSRMLLETESWEGVDWALDPFKEELLPLAGTKFPGPP
jgi:hypothetical protein